MKTIQCAHPPHHHSGFVATCRLWTASGGVLLIYLDYYVSSYSVMEIPTLHQVVYINLMLYNNVSILNVLCGEYQLKFQI